MPPLLLHGLDQALLTSTQLPMGTRLTAPWLTPATALPRVPSDVHQGFAALADYIRRHSPKLLIHGHQHVNRESVVGATRVVGVFRSGVIEV